jgi:hypothetical protein
LALCGLPNSVTRYTIEGEAGDGAAAKTDLWDKL